MSDENATPLSVEGLYEQLAAERAGQARAALARAATCCVRGRATRLRHSMDAMNPIALRGYGTPTAGETWVEGVLAAPLQTWAAAFERISVPRDLAPMVAGWFDETMGESMLALYRSAVDMTVTWPGALQRSRPPALAMLATGDPIRNHGVFRDVALRAGARIVELKGLGHFWMLQEPRLGARLLQEFWSSLA